MPWASQPDFLGSVKRRLHAKFIFASGYRKNSNACLNAWLYLGSGNLTTPGFLHACPVGNLEAGVLIADDSLTWDKESRADAHRWLGNRLPLQWDRKTLEAHELSGGEGMPDRPPAFEPAPIAWCRYLEAEAGQPARLQLPECEVPIEILDTESRACASCGPLQVTWPGARQPTVVVQWYEAGRQLRCSIPVIDGAGLRAAGQWLPTQNSHTDVLQSLP